MSWLTNALQNLSPVAFSAGPFEVHWYGLAYLAGFVGAAYLLWVFAKRWQVVLTADDVYTVVLWAVLGVMVGGRLGYVLFYGLPYYAANPGKVLAVWDGGMSFHGGFIGILLGGIIAARQTGISWFTLADLGAIGAPIGFGLGRITNFINGELWGRVTDLPWGVYFVAAGAQPRHPSQLYEAFLEGLVLLAVMVILARRMPPRPRGELFGWMTALYGVFRIVVEFFREPDASLGFIAGGWLTMGMVLSIPLVVAGVWAIARARTLNLSQEQVSRYAAQVASAGSSRPSSRSSARTSPRTSSRPSSKTASSASPRATRGRGRSSTKR